jgi:hypothetical protein
MSLTELVQQQDLFASSALHAVRVLPFNQRKPGLLCPHKAIVFTA